MFKLVVLSVVIAASCAAPAPGYLGGYALPAATSYSSRVDVHSKPLITHYAAPVITKTVVAAPVSYAVPAISHHGYGIHETPLVSSYGYGIGHHGVHGYGLGHDSYGYGHGLGYGYGHGLGYGHGW